jgi:hypothetical protein
METICWPGLQVPGVPLLGAYHRIGPPAAHTRKCTVGVAGHCRCASTIRGQFPYCATPQSRANAGVGRPFTLCIVHAMLSRIDSDPIQHGCRKSTIVQPTSYIPNLSLRGADNLSSRYHPRQFCISTRRTVVPYKQSKALLSESVSSSLPSSDNLRLLLPKRHRRAGGW